MARQVQFEGVTHQFPDDASDDEIRAALESKPPSPPSDSLMSKAGKVGGAVLASLSNVSEGVKGAVKGAARTALNIADLGSLAMPGGGINVSPRNDQVLAPTNTAQKVGMGAEQAAEFLIPGGAVSKGAKAIEGVTAGVRGAKALNVLGRAALEAGGASAVAGAQTGGDPTAMRNAALAAGGTSAVLGVASAGLPTKAGVAKRLYQSALKPAPSMDAAERAAIIQTGLKEGIVLNPDVVGNVQKRIADINDKISTEIANRSAAGATADPVAVAKYTDRAAKLAKAQVNPEADVSAVQGAKQEFLRSQSVDAPYTKIRPGVDEAAGTMVPDGSGVTQVPQDIPLSEAQKLKQGTYRKLKDSYGEQASASREAQKDLARGLKEQIVAAFPEISQLNAKESALLNLESSLERFVGRDGNRQLIGLGTPMTATAVHAAGGPVLALTGLKALIEQPEIKSRIAIALARAAANPGPVSKAASGAAALAPKAAAYGVMPPPEAQPRQIMPPPQ